MLKKISIYTFILLLLFSVNPVNADKKEERQWKDEVIYSLMVDRFNNGDTKNDFEVNLNDLHSYQGGDFKGIVDRLDWIKEMGFTAIQLSPVFENEEGDIMVNGLLTFIKRKRILGQWKNLNN